MLKLCPNTMIGKRDRALLAFGFASAMRRGELCTLQLDDISEAPDGLRVLIRRSKTGQEGHGQGIAIPRGYRLRPVEALQNWLDAAQIAAGPVFRRVSKRGNVGTTKMDHDSFAAVIRKAGRTRRPRSQDLRRPQPQIGVPDKRCRERRQHMEAGRAIASPQP
jgi:integrase